jgi:hypothetical protein
LNENEWAEKISMSPSSVQNSIVGAKFELTYWPKICNWSPQLSLLGLILMNQKSNSLRCQMSANLTINSIGVRAIKINTHVTKWFGDRMSLSDIPSPPKSQKSKKKHTDLSKCLLLCRCRPTN